MYSLARTIAPAAEPVTVDQAKEHCRIDDDANDDLIAIYIQAAREYVEKRINRALLQQTWRLSMDRFPFWRGGVSEHAHWSGTQVLGNPFGYLFDGAGILLPMANLIGIGSVKYIDPSGTLQTLDPSKYIVDSDSTPARVVPAIGTYWPYGTLPQPGAVQVTYVAGYGSVATAVPASIQLAILMLTGYFYDNRDTTVQPGSATELSTESLLAEHVVPAFTYEN